jgi:hypothetical protein
VQLLAITNLAFHLKLPEEGGTELQNIGNCMMKILVVLNGEK